jgi:hypothetical protein
MSLDVIVHKRNPRATPSIWGDEGGGERGKADPGNISESHYTLQHSGYGNSFFNLFSTFQALSPAGKFPQTSPLIIGKKAFPLMSSDF